MLTPSQEYARTGYRKPEKLLRGLDARVNGAIGCYRRRGGVLAHLQADAEAIDDQAAAWKDLPSAVIHARLIEFRERFRRGGDIGDETLFAALAAIREAADRQLGLRPFTVQLMGALALHRGYLAEMATGEGKTLTAGVAAVLGGWTRKPFHIITVNDYLVERDADWLRPLYSFCGVRVGTVTAPMSPPERQKGYGCDVTYTTSKELLADFLRDRLRLGAMYDPTRRLIRRLLAPQAAAADGVVLRGLHGAIVDEADSILIDEAVTPLIISAQRKNEVLREAGHIANQLVAELEPASDYRANTRYKEIELTESGLQKLQRRGAELPGLWRGRDRSVELIRQALVAREFYHRDKQYVVVDGKIVIVDEFTGRPMPQRTWREGMHQAVEAKEGLTISDPSETIARLSFQRFFRCFHRLSGMTGTAHEAAGEFWQIYKLPVITIPTNEPCRRRHLPDRVFATEAAKIAAVADAAAEMHTSGRPVLVGTRSVALSERLAAEFVGRGIECKVLNAVRLAEEAAIVALAGERGRITIATNMAGRGTDIRLGHGVAALGGLHVIATERHDSGRVDRQLYGRSGRQGDPGSAQAFVSVEDELPRRHLPKAAYMALVKTVQGNLPGRDSVARAAFAMAQRRAQQFAASQRATVLKTDTWLDESLAFAGGEGI